MGTPPLAAICLEALLKSPRFEVVLVVSQPDRPKGRNLRPVASAVKEVALKCNLPILQPEKARDPSFCSQLAGYHPQVIVVAAYGQILPAAILELSPHGCVNVHTSLLPRYRGAAPIQWAILNGDAETGVTLMKMDAQMDTGPIIVQESLPITEDDTSTRLHDRLAHRGAAMLEKYLPSYLAGDLQESPQPTIGVSYARRIEKEDGLIDWSLSADTLSRRFRAFLPWPGFYTFLSSSSKAGPIRKLLKIWSVQVTEGRGKAGSILRVEGEGIIVACGDQALRLLEVQIEGGKRIPASVFAAGLAISAGSILG